MLKGYLVGRYPPPPGGAPEILDILPSGGYRSDGPRGGLTGPGLESDRPLGQLFLPPRSGHDSGPGEGESPPPMMPLMQHVCTLGGLEGPTPIHGDVCQGHGEEAGAAGRGGGPHRRVSVLPGLWSATGGGFVFQIPWEGLDRIQR